MKHPITSTETMTLTVRGMRGSSVYEFANGELRLYREWYAGEETLRECEACTSCDGQTATALMNACNAMRWDGFHGKHPNSVSDGDRFIFEAAVNNGQTIRAEGSANFPKGYREFVRGLDAMLGREE